MSVTVKFDVNFSAWLDNIEIEADTVEEAEEKLHQLSLKDLADMANEKDSEVSDITYVVTSADYLVKARNINWNIDAFGLDDDDEEERLVAETRQTLPTVKEVKVHCKEDDIEDYAKMEIEDSVLKLLPKNVSALIDDLDIEYKLA